MQIYAIKQNKPTILMYEFRDNSNTY